MNDSEKQVENEKKLLEPKQLLGFPRLMNLQTAADYCSVGLWTIRQAIQRGYLPVCEWPDEDGEPMRRVLLDRKDLDDFVDGLIRRRQQEKYIRKTTKVLKLLRKEIGERRN